jgi:GNAT superfamily N-acetyltransferase
MYRIELIPAERINSIIPLLRILDPNIEEQMLYARLQDMCAHNYECVGVYDGDKLIGISGLWTLSKYYVGRHIEPDNVVIHPDYRSKGIGEQLMLWIYDYARSKGCIATELNCYVSNSAGVAFWIKQGFRILGFHMQKKI